MHCDEARDSLLERLDDPDTAGRNDTELDRHLEGCEACRALRDDILHLESRTQAWHELQAPPWTPDRIPRPPGSPAIGAAAAIQQWFPALASAATLLLAAGIYWRGDAGSAPPPNPSTVVQSPRAATAAQDARWLAVARDERRRDLAALTALLKAEMDRRSDETEQSLKYLISHQIRSQQELDAVRGKLEGTGSGTSEQL